MIVRYRGWWSFHNWGRCVDDFGNEVESGNDEMAFYSYFGRNPRWSYLH